MPGAPDGRRRAPPSASTSYASMSGFESSSPASRSTTARAAASSAASTVSSTRRPTRTPRTPSIPRWPRLPSTARPCGSRIPAFGVTLTANRKSGHRAIDVLREVALEARAGDPLERLDVAGPGAVDDVGGQLRARARSCPRLRLEPVADELLVEARLRLGPAHTPRRPRSATSRASGPRRSGSGRRSAIGPRLVSNVIGPSTRSSLAVGRRRRRTRTSCRRG